MSVSVSMKMTAKQSGALYMKAIKLEDRVKELENIVSSMADILNDVKNDMYPEMYEVVQGLLDQVQETQK